MHTSSRQDLKETIHTSSNIRNRDTKNVTSLIIQVSCCHNFKCMCAQFISVFPSFLCYSTLEWVILIWFWLVQSSTPSTAIQYAKLEFTFFSFRFTSMVKNFRNFLQRSSVLILTFVHTMPSHSKLRLLLDKNLCWGKKGTLRYHWAT